MVADRLSTRRDNNISRLHVTLPVRNVDLFSYHPIYQELCDVLHFFSDDLWSFKFVHRSNRGRAAELQMRIADVDEPVEVVLWSGGLDALAGLYTRLEQSPNKAFTLFSVGNSQYMQGVQKKVFEALHEKLPSIRMKTEQISFGIKHNHSFRERRPTPKNPSPRTRGFTFLLLGAVGAYLEGQSNLYVYENGIGAINLPYLETALRRDHSHAVHPVSLCYVQNWISNVLQQPFQIMSPFLFSTKAELCRLLVEDDHSDLIKQTITCDRRRRNFYIQCGRCSSCLLRLQSLAICGMYEGGYAVLEARHSGHPYKVGDAKFLRAMSHQVEKLRVALWSDNPWCTLTTAYDDLAQVARWLEHSSQHTAATAQAELVNLYRRYVMEWNTINVRNHLGKDLLAKEELEMWLNS